MCFAPSGKLLNVGCGGGRHAIAAARFGFKVTAVDYETSALKCARRFKEGKRAVNWARLSCHDFADNQVGLQLFALVYNLGNFLRRLALPASVKY